MGFLKKQSKDSFLLQVQIKPNSKKQDIIDNGDYLTILIRSRPIQNKANKELLNFLKKKFKISSNQIQIISGSKSINKLIKLTFSDNMDERIIIKKLLS